MMMMRELESGGVLSASSKSSFSRVVVSEYQPKRSEQNAFIHSRYAGSRFRVRFDFCLTPKRRRKRSLSLRKRRKKRRLSDDDVLSYYSRLLFSLSLSLKKTHRPVARVNQPRRFVRVDFRLLFPVASGIDDISRSRGIIIVAHLHDDDDGGGACVFVLFLSFSLSLSLRVFERSFDESER